MNGIALPIFVEVLTTALAVLFVQMTLKNRRPFDQNSRSIDDLRPEYGAVYTTQVLAYAMIAVPFIPLWYFCLRWVSKWQGSLLGAAQFVVLPSEIFWMLPALFAGLFSAILPVSYLYKRKLGLDTVNSRCIRICSYDNSSSCRTDSTSR